MDRIADYLREKYGLWGWMGQRAHDACGINRILPLDFIISCDNGTDIPHYFREKDVFSVEKRLGARKDWSNEMLKTSLKGALGREIFEYWNKCGKPVNLLCYRSVRKLENANGRLRRKVNIYAVPERMKRYFDNKIRLFRQLAKLSLPRIPGVVDKLGRASFGDLRADLSLPFVVQFPYGSSGLFTFIIRTEKEYNRLQRTYPDQTVIIRKYIDGFSMNANAVIVSVGGKPRTVCSFPSVQITGRPECSNFPSAFCGNDYTAARDIDKALIRQMCGHLSTIGGWMAEKGYRGIFGMDFVTKDGVVYPVEINPRFQNSTSLFTVLKISAPEDERALFLLHIAEFLQKNDKRMRKFIGEFPFEDLMRPVKGCQVVLHNRTRRNIVTGELAPGVYRAGEKGITFLKKGASLDACREPDQILVTCGVPEPYIAVEPNAPLCKVQMFESALSPADKRSFTGEAKKIISRVYRKLALKDAVRVEEFSV